MRHAMAIVGLFLLSVLGLWGLSDLRTPPRPAATGQRSLRQIVRKPTRTGRLNCGAQSGYIITVLWLETSLLPKWYTWHC